MTHRSNEEKFAFDQNGRLSPEEWDRLFSRLDEEIRQAEENSARKAGWSEAMDELWADDLWAEEMPEEGEELEEENEESEEEIPEWEMDMDAF